ncbi:MAG: pyridoxal-phosphate dependent enzyme, partial [Haloarculaceae archaeon]
RSAALSAELDAEVYLKREDTLPTGAFKVRGGVTLTEWLPAEFRAVGLVAASTGNHGQSVAYAGREVDVPVTICVPADANPQKAGAIEALGAEVVRVGDTFDDAREHAEALAADEGLRYVHSGNEPALVAGVATAGLEVLEDLPGVDVVLTPVGGGSSAAGYCLTVGDLGGAAVIGVQSAAAPAMYRAWQADTLAAHDRMETFAEGLATSVPFALTTRVLRDRLADFRLVTDDELRDAMAWLLREDGILCEGASAAPVAAALAAGEEFAGQTVVIPVSGRNLSLSKLRSVLD